MHLRGPPGIQKVFANSSYCIQRANFKTWNTSQLSFRGLKCLVLKLYDKLEVVPFEFAGVSSLEQITLESSKYAISSAKAIKAEKEKKNNGKAAESNSGMVNQSFKFKLTIFPPETPDSSATQRIQKRSSEQNCLIALYEQEFRGCDRFSCGCKSGVVISAFEYVINNGGISPEKDYPYLGMTCKCRFESYLWS